MKHLRDPEALDASSETFGRRRDRRKPRGRLRAAELVNDAGDVAPVPEIAWMIERGYLDTVEGELKSGKAHALLARDAASLCATFRAHGVEAAPETVVQVVLEGG